MKLSTALGEYLAGLRLHGGNDHQEQAAIILQRLVKWLVMARPGPLPDDPPRQISELHELSTQDLTEFLIWRGEQPGLRKGTLISDQTLNKEIRYIRCWLNYCDEDRLTFGLPADWRRPQVRWIKVKRRTPASLTEPNLQLVFHSCQFATRPKIPAVSPPDWWRTFLYLAYVTSMRRRALFGFPRPADADLAAKTLFVSADYDKSGEDRIYPLTDLAVTWIKKMPAAPGEPLFQWDRQDLRSFYTHLHLMQNRAGIDPAQHGLPHLLRKSNATHLVQNGVELAVVQRQLGHSTPQITEQFYVGCLTDQQRKAVDQLVVPTALKTTSRQLTLF